MIICRLFVIMMSAVNRRVLAVSDNSTANKQVKRDATSAVWSAKQAMDGDSGSAGGTYVSTATVRQHAAV